MRLVSFGTTLALALGVLADQSRAGSLAQSSHPGCDYEFRGQIIPRIAARLPAPI